MHERKSRFGFKVAGQLYDLINFKVLPGTGISGDDFWLGLTDILNDFMPRNRHLLAKRDMMQRQIDEWHLNPQNQPFDVGAYHQFLDGIGYIETEKEDFLITTQNVDPEVAMIAGPQLVVPVMNARYALNAANARWGSLYDALYGTDAIAQTDGAEVTAKYNPKRGDKVIEYARAFLDKTIPLGGGSHSDAKSYQVVDQQLQVTLNNDEQTGLVDGSQFAGFSGDAKNPTAILCSNNGLHLEIQIDHKHLIGKDDAAGVKDVLLESAISTIQDCEDSIAAVDGPDKTLVYSNWLGLMKGDLSESLQKNGKMITRTLNPDRCYTAANGEALVLPGRSLQFIRNVGHLMTTNAILTETGKEVPEGILDAVFTSLIALHDVKGLGKYSNSRTGSIYIVKPKMHGPQEVQFTCDLFSRVESLLNLPQNTIKMGIMDEERRTSVNLKECIRVAKERVVFINTGFLDRTGDEIHTSMHAGPMVPKDSMKDEKWISAYEARNVQIGLQAGFKGKAQIGKGMWAVPDQMAQMLKDKVGHPKSGASCAWVPSPTAATLHVMHYHEVNVADVQTDLLKNLSVASLDDLITIPLLADPSSLTDEQIQAELDNNIQGLLGYVVRWVDQGVGCSKVPDIHNVGRMEDRATLRISSQHVCNWWRHGLLDENRILESMERMAAIVDEQNAGDPNYNNMAPAFEKSIAFKAAVDLIFKGKKQPSGYTEPLLHKSRQQVKAK
jgi:malate synthase